MITPSSAFAPYIDGGGLSLGVNPGVALIGTTPTSIAGQSVALTANTTNYVFLNLTTGTLQVNTSGFSTGVFPIAIVVTTNNGIQTLTDQRTDVSSGGGGQIANGGSVISVSASEIYGETSDVAGFLASNGGGSYASFSQLFDAAGNTVIVGGGSGEGTNWAIENAAGSASISNPYGAATIHMHGAVYLDTGAATVGAGLLGLGVATATTATAGSASLPAAPVGFLIWNLGGTTIKLPYYAA